MNIGLIGCGSIGTTIAGAADTMDEISTIYLFDSIPDKAYELKSIIKKGVVSEDFDTLLDNCSLIIEAGSQQAVREYAIMTLERGIDFMMLSVGALADDALWNNIQIARKTGRSNIYLPSGAIAGLDGVTAAAASNITEATLVTRKPPAALRGIKYLFDRGIDVNEVDKETVVFEGSAREAVELFPKNINVSAALSLSGIGFERTKVKIILDPALTRNVHEIHVEGRFGRLTCIIENEPSLTNPKTSYLAALAGVSLLKKVVSGVFIGT